MAVELHYEEERGNPETGQIERVHWRILVNDEAAATAQAAQDILEGRNPVAVVAQDDPAAPKWNVRRAYNPADWRTLMDAKTLRKRAQQVGPAIE
jgi:hypothetical protein